MPRRLVQRHFSSGPLFVAKTERASCPESHLHNVHLKALAPFVGPNLKVDTNNCVVCAIKIYLARTKDIRQGRKRLFLAYKPGHTEEIKATTISFWIVKTVRYTYDNLPDDSVHHFKVRAHDVRAFTTSWNALQQVSLHDILQAAQWRSHTAFSSFYLTDLTVVEEDLLKIGPLVTAQQVMNLH